MSQDRRILLCLDWPGGVAVLGVAGVPVAGQRVAGRGVAAAVQALLQPRRTARALALAAAAAPCTQHRINIYIYLDIIYSPENDAGSIVSLEYTFAKEFNVAIPPPCKKESLSVMTPVGNVSIISFRIPAASLLHDTITQLCVRLSPSLSFMTPLHWTAMASLSFLVYSIWQGRTVLQCHDSIVTPRHSPAWPGPRLPPRAATSAWRASAAPPPLPPGLRPRDLRLIFFLKHTTLYSDLSLNRVSFPCSRGEDCHGCYNVVLRAMLCTSGEGQTHDSPITAWRLQIRIRVSPDKYCCVSNSTLYNI